MGDQDGGCLPMHFIIRDSVWRENLENHPQESALEELKLVADMSGDLL